MQEVEIRAFIQMLLDQKRTIFITLAVCVVLSTSITLLGIKREYIANTTLLYSQSSMGSSAGALAGSLGLSMSMAQTGPSAWFETILTSRSLATKMVRKYKLVPILGAKDEFDAVAALMERVVITPKPEANAVLVAVKIPGTPIKFPGLGMDRDRAQLAADIANDLVAELDHWMKSTDYQSSSQERKFIQKQLADVLGQANLTKEQLKAVFKRSGVFSPDNQAQAYLQAMAALEGDLATARTELKGTQLAQAEGMSKDDIRRLASAADAEQKASALTDDLRKNIADLEVQLRRETMVNHKTEEHPDVAQLRQSLNELKSKLNTELAIINEARALQAKKLTSAVSMGEQRWSKLQGMLTGLPNAGLQVEQYKRELQNDMDLISMLTKQLYLAEISEQQQSQNFNVLDPAEAPQQKSSPSLGMGLAVGFAVGLLLGVLLAALKRFLHPLEEAVDQGAAV